eukprot:3187073-Pleurochrysis_carterae.AAC.1
MERCVRWGRSGSACGSVRMRLCVRLCVCVCVSVCVRVGVCRGGGALARSVEAHDERLLVLRAKLRLMKRGGGGGGGGGRAHGDEGGAQPSVFVRFNHRRVLHGAELAEERDEQALARVAGEVACGHVANGWWEGGRTGQDRRERAVGRRAGDLRQTNGGRAREGG